MQVEIKHGSILCAKCNTTLREAGLCPNCKYPSACIKIGYKGKTYWYYLDDNLKAYDYGAALDAVIAINREIAKTSLIRSPGQEPSQRQGGFLLPGKSL